MKITNQATVALCPDCEEEINFRTLPKQGQKLTCPNCEAYLQVVSVKPLRLDWDDDSEYFDDDWASGDDDW